MGSRRVGEFVTTKIIRRRRATSNVNPASSAAGVDRFVGWFCDSGWIPWIVDLIWIHECEFDSRTRNGSGVEQHLSAGEAAAALKEQAEHKCVCVGICVFRLYNAVIKSHPKYASVSGAELISLTYSIFVLVKEMKATIGEFLIAFLKIQNTPR